MSAVSVCSIRVPVALRRGGGLTGALTGALGALPLKVPQRKFSSVWWNCERPPGALRGDWILEDNWNI